MTSPYSAWADSLAYLHPYLSQSAPVSDSSRLPSADPTGVQPFTTSKNVSYFVPSAQETPPQQQHRLAAEMARKRHFAQPAPVAALPLAHNIGPHGDYGHDVQDFACNVAAEHCHFSPPCDKPDCDEATICFDHDAHDGTSCINDVPCCQEHAKCDDAFACVDDACDFDFDCAFLSCPETCPEAQHAQGCNTPCATVACSDPQCSQGVLHCCLSDICPHKPHTDCHPPCPQDCQQAHTHCVAPSTVPCHPPCNNGSDTSCTVSFQDSMSTSTISTPHTDPSDSLCSPTSLQFQSLVEAASNQAFLVVPGSNTWEIPSQYNRYFSRRIAHCTVVKLTWL